jgi:hypothetical protein
MSHLVRNAAPLTAEVDGELVMLDPRSSEYFGLDAVGHRIWELLEQPTSVDLLVTQLVNEYEVDIERCRAEVTELVDFMIDAGLVDCVDA